MLTWRRRYTIPNAAPCSSGIDRATTTSATDTSPHLSDPVFWAEAERESLLATLQESRLVTLTGPGGAGKTRLAVEAAREWSGGCWFVPLADVGEPERLPATVCDALGELVRSRSAPDSPDALLTRAANALNNFPAPLLILDNLEQIATVAGSQLLALLERVPSLHLLVTSRLRLHLPGEQELPVGPLPLPDAQAGIEADADLTAVSHVASVALFLDRARVARPDYQITPRNQSDILAICQILEGIPLAIELVAARSGSLVPTQMREKLVEQGNLRIADRRAEPEDRHRSLYAAIDWSYRLLPADLRAAFLCLAVFRGGFSAEAVAAVWDATVDTASEALARLRAHSLIGSVADASAIRFSLLESLRTFAAENLTPADLEAIQRRHTTWFSDLAEQGDAGLTGPAQGVWLERLETDLENLRTAFRAALTDDAPRALQIAGALWMFWHLRGRATEGRAWLAQALAVSTPVAEAADPVVIFQRARALHGMGTLAWVQGDGTTAQPLFEESLRLRRLIADQAAQAATLNNMGLLAWSRQEWDEARRFLGESLAIRRETGITGATLASSLLNLGVVDWERGDYAPARASFEEALALCREVGDRVGEGHALNNLGNIALAQSDFTVAAAWYEQSLAIKRTLGYPPGIAASLSNLGVTALYQAHYTAATAYFEEALALYREASAPDGVATQLRNLGQIATEQREWERARDLLGESLRIQRESDTPTDIAGNLEAFALLAVALGNPERAARLLGAASAQRIGYRSPLHPSERVILDRAIDTARAALDVDRFEAVWQEGETLTPDAAAEIAFAISR